MRNDESFRWNALSKQTSGISNLMYGKIRIIERSDNMKKVMRNGVKKSRLKILHLL